MKQTGSGAPSAAPYYTASYPATSRVISFNDFDGGGRQVDLQNGYQVWGGSSYNATQCLVTNACAYDPDEEPKDIFELLWTRDRLANN